MDAFLVTNFINNNRKYLFPNRKYTEAQVYTILTSAPDTFAPMLNVRFQSPGAALFLSVFFGWMGLDRFVAKNFFIGLFKLFTVGGFYVLWGLDSLTAMSRCRRRNCEKLLKAIREVSTYVNSTVPPRAPTPAPAFASTLGGSTPSTAPVGGSPYNAHQALNPQPIGSSSTSTAGGNPVRQTGTTSSSSTSGTPSHPFVKKPEISFAAGDIPVSDEPDVFLSYSHRDKERLLPLFAELQRSGLKIWFDYGIRAGAEWEEEIIQQLAKSKSFLFFVSESSLLSSNCRDELYQARKKNKKFINVLLDNVDLTKPEFEWFDFRYSRYQQIPAYSMTTEETVSRIHNGLS